MKTIVLVMGFCVLLPNVLAQAPQKMSYQAIIRNGDHALVTNQVIGMKISIQTEDSATLPVFVETQTAATNENGLVSVEIGSGTAILGKFNEIDWTEGPYFIKIEVDASGGSSYSVTGISPLLSVPYAFYAQSAGTADDAVKLTGDQTIEGKKNFTGGVTVPQPVNAGDAATKAYVDAQKGHYAGEIYGGGVVFYVDNSRQHGLIAEYDFLWAIWSNVQTQIGAAAQSPWDGFSNSLAIYNQPGMTTSAARTCFYHQSWTGMDDWFLPSVGQLHLLYNVSYELNYTLSANINFTRIEGLVWSSTEDTVQGNGKAVDLSTGAVVAYPKSTSLRVRPIRKF